MSDEGCTAQRKSGAPPGGATSEAPASVNNLADQGGYNDLLREYENSLENEDNRWRRIEALIVRNPPKVRTEEEAISCLEIVKRYGVQNEFGETLVDQVIRFLTRRA